MLSMNFLGWANKLDTKIGFVSMLSKPGNIFLRTQNISDKNQTHFSCLRYNFFVPDNCCAYGQTV